MKRLLLLNIGLTFLLIVWGGVVRNFDAGLACPDWPLCHGKIIPPLDPLIWIEWGHRLLASIVGVITLILAFSYRKRFGFIAFLPLAIVIFQALLGGMTVKGILAPKWVSLHLAFGLLYFLSLLWVYCHSEHEVRGISTGILRALWSELLGAGPVSGRSPSAVLLRAGGGSPLPESPAQCLPTLSASCFGKYLLPFCLFATLIVYLQAVLGGAVASSGAGLACPDFPTCYGAWLPELRGGITLQFFHRLGGVFVTLISIFLFLVILRVKPRVVKPEGSLRLDFKKRISLILILTLTQVGLGISNVLFRLPEMLSILHLAVATLLFANFVVLTYKVKHASSLEFNQTAN